MADYIPIPNDVQLASLMKHITWLALHMIWKVY